MKGIYILAVEAHGEVEIGRLGKACFDGLYLYIGSALGPGGFKRLERHLAVAHGKRKVRRWHIDYLLAIGEPKEVFVKEAEEGQECALARELARYFKPAVPGFGCSDCRCRTHLLSADGPWHEILSSLGFREYLPK